MKREIELAHPFSKSGKARLAATWKACQQVDREGIEGAFVECGVWRGGNVMVARWAAPSRQCWLYDTFNGMTEPSNYDMKRSGELATAKWIGKAAVSVEEVRRNLCSVGLYNPNEVHIVPGDVRKTLLNQGNLPDNISVLRLDTDFYDSTKIEMEILYPRLSSGGCLIVDDYGHWLGAKKAVDEYLGANNRLMPIDYTGAWMTKP